MIRPVCVQPSGAVFRAAHAVGLGVDDLLALASVCADGGIAHESDTLEQAREITKIGHGAVQRCPVVPHGDITCLPVPCQRVFRPGGVGEEQFQQGIGIGQVKVRQTLDEIAQNQAFLTRFGVNAHQRVPRFENTCREHIGRPLNELPVPFGNQIGVVVTIIGVDGPQLVRQFLQGFGQALIGCDGIGPQRCATIRGRLDAAEDGGLGVGRHEGHVACHVLAARPLRALSSKMWLVPLALATVGCETSVPKRVPSCSCWLLSSV